MSEADLRQEVAHLRALLATAARPDGSSPADLSALDDDDRLGLLREVELLTRALAGLSTRLQAQFHTSQVAAQVADGVAPSRAGQAVADDLAVARMTSPSWGSRGLASARALTVEMPRTLGALDHGIITGEQSRLITELTTCLDPEDRAEVDARLVERLPGLPPARLRALVLALVYEIDPKGFVDRARRAAADRGVSLRAAPDVMGVLSARLPAAQATAAFACLQAAARAMRASGDPRTLQQLMADELYSRLTGRTVVDGVDVEVGLVITDSALLAGTSDPAELIGYGPLPADIARELLRPTGTAAPEIARGLLRPTGTTAPEIARERLRPTGTAAPEIARELLRPTGTAAPEIGRSTDVEAGTGSEPDEPSTVRGPAHGSGPSRGVTDGDDPAVRARADAAANAAGFPGGRVPPGYCPAGGRCADPSCRLTHGHPACGGSAPPSPTGPTGTPPSPGPPVTPGPGTALAARVPAEASQARAATVWLRRLYADPCTGVLVDRDTRRRLFTGSVRDFVIARDRYCANAWCGAPIRHVDHVVRHHEGGPTSVGNGRGLCARCNLARERPRHLDPDRVGRAGPEEPAPPPVLPCLPRPGPALTPSATAPAHRRPG